MNNLLDRWNKTDPVLRAFLAGVFFLGITLDHAVSMTVPALGGILWAAYGYKSVFMAASLLAIAGFAVALLVRDKGRAVAAPAGLESLPPSAD